MPYQCMLTRDLNAAFRIVKIMMNTTPTFISINGGADT